MNVEIHIYGLIAGEAVDNTTKAVVDENSPPVVKTIASLLRARGIEEVSCVMRDEHMHTTHVYRIDEHAETLQATP